MKKKTMLIIAAIIVVLILIAVAYKYRAKWMPGAKTTDTTKTKEQIAAEQAAKDAQAQSTSPYVQDASQSMAVDTSGKTVQPSSNAVPSHAVAGPTYKPPVVGVTQQAAAKMTATAKNTGVNGGASMSAL